MDTDQADQENEAKPVQEIVTKTPKGSKKEIQPPPAPGDLVFAKVKGYPFWPARVETEAPMGMKVGQGKYPVFFFGTYELAICGPKEILPFEPNKAKYGKSKAKKFLIGMKEIQETPNITCCPQSVVSMTVPVTPERPSDPVEAENGQDADIVSVPEQKKSKKPKSKEKRTLNSSSKNKKCKVEAGGDVKEAKEDPTNVSEPVPKESVQEQPLDNTSMVVEEDDEKKKDGDEEPKEVKPELSEEEKRTKKEQKAREKERLKQELKEKKLDKKRKERIENLKNQEVTTTTLTDLDIEIMQSLNVESLDVSRCLNAMSKLDLIQVNQDILIQYPNILYTIKKCRKFKGDEIVRQKADYLFNKFKILFSTGVGESTRKLLDLTSEASQDSSSSPTREDSAKSDPPKTSLSTLETDSEIPKSGLAVPPMPHLQVIPEKSPVKPDQEVAPKESS